MDDTRRLWRRLRLGASRIPHLIGAAVEAAPSAVAGIATVVLAALGVLLLGLLLSVVAALLA